MIRIKEFFDETTCTLTYVVWDSGTLSAVIIDPVLEYDPARSSMNRGSLSSLVAFLKNEKLRLHYILETHVHADHVSGAQVLREQFPEARVAIGAGITEIQRHFKSAFRLPESFPTDGSQFDRLLHNRERLAASGLTVEVLSTPGHTASCVCYRIGNALFTGDTLFMPDYGVGRCDFPTGSPKKMYESVTLLYQLPEDTRVFTGHDYLPGGRSLRFESTIGEEKRANIHINAETIEADFIHLRTMRDKTLDPPKLFSPSVRVNINAGR